MVAIDRPSDDDDDGGGGGGRNFWRKNVECRGGDGDSGGGGGGGGGRVEITGAERPDADRQSSTSHAARKSFMCGKSTLQAVMKGTPELHWK